jgi:hypothetical protein
VYTALFPHHVCSLNHFQLHSLEALPSSPPYTTVVTQHIRSWLRRSFVSYHSIRSLSGTSFLTKPSAGHLLPSRSIDLFSYIIMYSRSIYVALGFIFATSSSAVPTQSPGSQLSGLHSLVGRALTTDNTCGNVLAGNGNNYTCNPALAQGGACCSATGYCGLFYSSS